jgi:hypothetical protein
MRTSVSCRSAAELGESRVCYCQPIPLCRSWRSLGPLQLLSQRAAVCRPQAHGRHGRDVAATPDDSAALPPSRPDRPHPIRPADREAGTRKPLCWSASMAGLLRCISRCSALRALGALVSVGWWAMEPPAFPPAHQSHHEVSLNLGQPANAPLAYTARNESPLATATVPSIIGGQTLKRLVGARRGIAREPALFRQNAD